MKNNLLPFLNNCVLSIFVIFSSERIFATFVTSENHKQFASQTWPGPLSTFHLNLDIGWWELELHVLLDIH